MGSYKNVKNPTNIDKPPLFNSAYRGAVLAESWDGYKSVNFNAQRPVEREICAPVGNSLTKIPKVETEMCFSSDTGELPSLKRPKYNGDITFQHVQILPMLGRETKSVPLFSAPPETVGKRDISDNLVDEAGCMMKRFQSTDVTNQLNLLNEPSPLGLNLRKSPSLLDLIQRRLSHNEDEGGDVCDKGGKIDKPGNSSSSDKDKLKAANFPAVKLRVGTWECISRYDGDLVAKCYYAKRKLVWEVLDSSLKSKMEVQWSDISGLRASFLEDQSAVLDIELSRPPLFFREINPQPRKHTLWQSTSDFTDGQATICRHHSVQFPVGVLNRHFEKLLQCDMRLKALHEKNLVIVDSCFYDNRNIQIDRQHSLHYQTVLSDHPSVQSLTMSGLNDHLQHALCSVDSFQGHHTIQGPQNDSQLTHHHMVESRFTLEGLQTESLKQTLRKHSDFGGPPRIQHPQGGFQLQFSSASPSSVIDIRGSTECSSSSETEEVPKREILHVDRQILQNKNDYTRQFPSASSVHFQTNQWTSSPSHLTEGSLAWERAASPMIQAEKQALNALSIHLLGEPITPTPSAHTFSLGRPNTQETTVGNAGSHSCEQPCCLQKAPKDLVELRHGYLPNSQARDICWDPMVENCTIETGTRTVASRGSYVDLVYLPRIASQPHFLERGLQN